MNRRILRTARTVGIVGFLASAFLTAASGPASANTVTIYICNYTVDPHGFIHGWEYPGGKATPGNVSKFHTTNTPFDSQPWVSSTTIDGQRWIYGELIPFQGGPYGWVGVNYLTSASCATITTPVTNGAVSSTNNKDDFASAPYADSGTYFGQDWVWGVASSASKAGWIGRSYLTPKGCDKTGCYYVINQSGIHEWYLPGGANM